MILQGSWAVPLLVSPELTHTTTSSERVGRARGSRWPPLCLTVAATCWPGRLSSFRLQEARLAFLHDCLRTVSLTYMV